MRSLRTLTILALAASLTGVAPAGADPGDGQPPYIPPSGPTCYGGNYTYHVWNLFHPMETYGYDSCRMNEMIAKRRISGTYAQFLAAMTTAKYPNVGVPSSILTFLWNVQTDTLAVCHAPGRGVEFTVSNLNGQVINCSAQ